MLNFISAECQPKEFFDKFSDAILIADGVQPYYADNMVSVMVPKKLSFLIFIPPATPEISCTMQYPGEKTIIQHGTKDRDGYCTFVKTFVDNGMFDVIFTVDQLSRYVAKTITINATRGNCSITFTSEITRGLSLFHDRLIIISSNLKY